MFDSSFLGNFRSALLGYRSKLIYIEFCNYIIETYSGGSSRTKNNRGYSLKELEKWMLNSTLPSIQELKNEFTKDLAAGKKVLRHYMASSFQGWDQGSSLFFLALVKSHV